MRRETNCQKDGDKIIAVQNVSLAGDVLLKV